MRGSAVLCLIDSPFQARDVMSGKPGAAVQLMYQLFMALNRKTVSLCNNVWYCAQEGVASGAEDDSSESGVYEVSCENKVGESGD